MLLTIAKKQNKTKTLKYFYTKNVRKTNYLFLKETQHITELDDITGNVW